MSLLIPTYNGRDVLVRLLDSLRAAEPADGFKWEVIVIDNKFPDDSKSAAPVQFRSENRLHVRLSADYGMPQKSLRSIRP